MSDSDAQYSQRHDALVTRLVADVHPVRRVWPPVLRLTAWTTLAGLIMGAFTLRSHLPGLEGRLFEPLFAAQIASLAIAAVWCCWLALRAGVPGREPRAPELLATMPLLGLPALLALGQAPEAIGDPRVFVWAGLTCTPVTFGLAAIPWIAGLVALRRAAPVSPRIAAALAGAAALLAAAAAVRAVCPLGDARWHLLAWHLLPVAVGAAVSAGAMARWIQPWQQRHNPRDLTAA